MSRTQSSAVTPDCITDPYTGGCANWYVVSVGGQFTQEPIQEPDWCGPGAETAVAMHWIGSTVANFGSVWVQSQRSSDYGASVQLTGAQGWMGNMAYNYHFYSNRSGGYINGIERFSSKAAWDTDMRDSMNSAFAGGYYVIKDSSVIKQESDLYGNATYDLAHDGHPMIFLVNASQLPEWPRSSLQINHYIEGYAYAFWTDHNSNATNKIYYADTASADDSGTAGDYGMTYDDFWNGPWKTGSQVIIV